MSEELEGWAAPVRMPLIAALAIVCFLTVALAVGGWCYVRLVAPGTRPPAAIFPAPRLEIVRSAPGEPRRAVALPPPRGIARAMAETAREGDAVWGGPAR